MKIKEMTPLTGVAVVNALYNDANKPSMLKWGYGLKDGKKLLPFGHEDVAARDSIRFEADKGFRKSTQSASMLFVLFFLSPLACVSGRIVSSLSSFRRQRTTAETRQKCKTYERSWRQPLHCLSSCDMVTGLD